GGSIAVGAAAGCFPEAGGIARGTREIADAAASVPKQRARTSPGPRPPPLEPCDQAAFFRFASSCASTSSTVSSTTSDRMLFCAARVLTSLSTRSMLGAPAYSARAADDGVSSDSAALAYFSNGTRSRSAAPSDLHRVAVQL